MNRITPLAERAYTITLSRADYEALLSEREDAIDLAAVHVHDAQETALGKVAARADFLTMEEVDRLTAGGHRSASGGSTVA
jgi:hypothetical protein